MRKNQLSTFLLKQLNANVFSLLVFWKCRILSKIVLNFYYGLQAATTIMPLLVSKFEEKCVVEPWRISGIDCYFVSIVVEWVSNPPMISYCCVNKKVDNWFFRIFKEFLIILTFRGQMWMPLKMFLHRKVSPNLSYIPQKELSKNTGKLKRSS